MIKHTRALSALLALSFVAATPAAIDGVMTLKPESKLWVDGTSTVRGFSCAATTFDARIAAGDQAVSAVLGGTKAIQTVDISVPVSALDCKNGKMNDHMRKALKAEEHPVIAFRLASYELVPSGDAVRATLTGTLTMGGVDQPITFDADVTPGESGALHVAGAVEVNMKDFGLKPPSLMMGTMKVREKVNVKFELSLQQ